jgi:outer membrane immunogenic protein
MNKLLVATAGALALFAAQPLSAADMPVKAPRPVIEVWSWDGFYIGINGGYSWGRSKTDVDFFNANTGVFLGGASGTLNLDGPIFGGQVGFNRQNGNWVWGLEGDIQWSGQKGDAIFTCAPTLACNNLTFGPGLNVPVTGSFEQKLSWFATLRGRLDVTVTPTVLAYVTGGLAIGHIETEGVLTGFTAASAPTSAAFSYDKTKLGWTVGGGLEGRLSGNWTAKIEYIYADYGSVSGTGLLTTNVVPLRAEFDSQVTDHVLRAGINYKFGPAR